MPLSDQSLSESQPLKRAVRLGAGSMAAVQVASQVISIASIAILMRLLAPAEYGLLGMVLPLVMLLRIFSTLGLNMATVQRRELSVAEVNSMFWMNVALGAATMLATAAIAPAVGWLYAKPDLSDTLRDITLALSATSLLVALGAQHTALLERNLRLPQVGTIRVVSQFAGALGTIAAALANWGVWALVVGHYIELTLLAGLAWWCLPWRPGWPGGAAPIAPVVRWGCLFAISSVFLYVADNLDKVLVGRLVSPQAVGLYERAWALMVKPVYLVTMPLTGLLLASLSRASESPAAARNQLLIAYYRLTAILLLPASLGLAVVAGDVIQLIGGSRWAEAGPLLAVLSLGMFAQAVVILNGYVLTAAGRTDRLLVASLLVLATLVVGYVGGWWIGNRSGQPTFGLAVGYAVAIGIVSLPHTWFSLRSAGAMPQAVLATWRLPLVSALVMAGLVWMFGQWLENVMPTVRLLVLIPLGVLAYAALARDEITWLATHVRHLRGDGKVT